MPSVNEVKTENGCPLCDQNALAHLETVGNLHLWKCNNCTEIFQSIDGKLSPISTLLKRNAMGDDRVRAAASSPYVKTVKGFLDVYEDSTRNFELGVAEAKGALRAVLAQMENRLDYALSRLSGIALVDEGATEALNALREVRDFVSVTRGRPQKGE